MATWSYAKPEDALDLTDLLFEVFKGPGFDALFPGEGGRAFMQAMYEVNGKPWQERKVLVVRDGDGKIISSVICYFIRPEDNGLWIWQKRNPPPTHEMGLNEEAVNGYLSVTNTLVDKYLGKEPFIFSPVGLFLTSIPVVECAMTHPDHQKKGYMSTLLDVGNQLADELDYPIFLLASEQGKPGYLKKGYEVVDATVTFPGSPMLRKKKSDRS
ncbi:hypothetical protein BX600DRAFT_503477 [Xylariales sp. PMI_506]|nr:hypothetical protein BX600DRAFT_503477 [Xylariales sp. PMI_506]